MKLSVAILILLFSLGTINATVKYGSDKDIGPLSDPEVGSVEEKLSEAFNEPYSLEWVENFVSKEDQKIFTMQYSKNLLSLLPLEDYVYSSSEEGTFFLKSRKNKAIITVFYDSGLINSLGISTY